MAYAKIVNAAARLVKIDLSFLTNKISKSKSIFSPKNRGFLGVTLGPLGSPFVQLVVHEKLFGVY